MSNNDKNGQISPAKLKAIEKHNKAHPEDKLPVTTEIPWKIIRSKRQFKDIRLSEVKKNIFLKAYAERFNKAKAAYKAGCSVRAIYFEIEGNPDFANQVKEIERTYTENMIESGLTVATLPTREGATDRKLLLPALDDRFKNKPIEINNNTLTINLTNATPSARKVLQKYNAVQTDFKVIEDID